MRDIADYRTGSFVDYLGNNRNFVVCALSQSPEIYDDYSYEVGWVDENGVIDESVPVKRCLSIAVSICMPEDEFNLETGKKIAEKKAEQDFSCIAQIHVTKSGIINKEFVDLVLDKQVKYIAENPEKCSIKYKEAKELYEFEKKLKDTATAEEWTAYLLLRDKKVKRDYLLNILNK